MKTELHLSESILKNGTIVILVKPLILTVRINRGILVKFEDTRLCLVP